MSLKLETPKYFPAFPFQPYEIQLQLMQHLYTSIEGQKVTIVESPTGTVILSLSDLINMLMTQCILGQDAKSTVRIVDVVEGRTRPRA